MRPLAADDPRHGTNNGYTNLKCRCDLCRAANAIVQRSQRDQRHAQGLPITDPRHGTDNGYGNWGCRCERCTAAWSAACLPGNRRRHVAKIASRPETLCLDCSTPLGTRYRRLRFCASCLAKHRSRRMSEYWLSRPVVPWMEDVLRLFASGKVGQAQVATFVGRSSWTVGWVLNTAKRKYDASSWLDGARRWVDEIGTSTMDPPAWLPPRRPAGRPRIALDETVLTDLNLSAKEVAVQLGVSVRLVYQRRALLRRAA